MTIKNAFPYISDNYGYRKYNMEHLIKRKLSNPPRDIFDILPPSIFIIFNNQFFY